MAGQLQMLFSLTALKDTEWRAMRAKAAGLSQGVSLRASLFRAILYLNVANDLSER